MECLVMLSFISFGINWNEYRFIYGWHFFRGGIERKWFGIHLICTYQNIMSNLVFVGNWYIMVASDISKLTLVYNRLSKDNTVYHFPFFHFFSFPSVMSLLLHYPAFTMPLHLPSSLKHIRQYILCCVHLKCKQRCLNLV